MKPFRLSDHLDKWILRPPWARETASAKPGCVLWVGASRDCNGSRRPNVHKRDLVYRLLMGNPKGMSVCHVCDRSMCVCVDHLWVGTQAENLRDASNKNRMGVAPRRATHCRRGHPYDEANTGWSVIHASRRDKNHVVDRWRYCKTCNLESTRQSYLRRKAKRAA